MGTILLTCVCDSMTVKLCGNGCRCITEIHEAATNCKDVAIASVICCSIVKVTLIVVGGFLLWKLIDYIAKGIDDHYKRHCDVEDIKRKQEAETKKNKTDLIGKKLEILRELCYETETINKDIKERKKLKEHKDDNDVGKYISALKDEINKDTVTENSESNG